jgi:hypothetical protein
MERIRMLSRESVALVTHFTALVFLTAAAVPTHGQVKAPKIWDDEALRDWATSIAALGVRPGHFTSAEYYAVPADNLKTYPVYRPDREPPGYWEWLQKQRPQPLVDASKLHTREDWVRAGEAAFREMDDIAFRTGDPERIRAARDLKSWAGIWTQPDGTSISNSWIVTPAGIQLTCVACAGACHARVKAYGTVLWGAP